MALTVGGNNDATIQIYGGVISGSGSLTKNGSGLLRLLGANTYTGTTTLNSGILTLYNTLALQNSTLVYNGGTARLVPGMTSPTLGGLSGSAGLALTTFASLTAVALTVGNNNASTAFSGAIIDGTVTGGSLTKIGTGTLALTGASTYTGGTTIKAGTIVARGTALGTGATTIASGATLGVGEDLNTTLSPLTTNSLSAQSLVVTLGSATPLLTFNLGASGTSDTLNLTGAGNELTFSGSGAFNIGFAGATGAALGAGTYNLMNFSTPEALASLPTITSYGAVAQGNLQAINGGAFSYLLNGGNVSGLQFTITGADATPEPGSIALALLGLPGVGALALRRRWAKA